ncbi:MAG: biosynthetic-type acetolactate synthase large subunit [Flavobacteriales bacterium]|nr:MAG: biosynthetic-type acetolactate synthase large subunit [Flavobacteriales bacterium]
MNPDIKTSETKHKDTASQDRQHDRILTGSQALIESLLCEGTEVIFGYPGGQIIPVYDALYDYRDRINHVLVRHEQGAAHAAEGYARASGRVGVCMVTSGPGATNTVTGLADAMLDSTPLVVISGQVGTGLLGTDAFQETNFIGITQAVTKWNCQVKRAEDIPEAIAKAFYIAKSGRPGPVVVDITKDAQVQKAPFSYEKICSIRSYDPSPEPDCSKIEEAAKLINLAKKPLVMVGQGVILGGAEHELLSFLDKSGVPAASTLLGLSAIPSAHPQNVGMLGMHGNYGPNIKNKDCDLIIAIGMRFDDRVTGNPERFGINAKVIHFEIDPSEINKIIYADVPVVGDVKRTLPLLTALVHENDHSAWIDEFRACYDVECEKIINRVTRPSSGPLRMGEVVDRVSCATRGDAVLVTDVGQHQMMAARYFKFNRPRSIITSGGLGTMGFGLPAAIGAKLAVPEREVCLFVGDGGFQMNIQELATVFQTGAAVKVILLNNGYLGMVRQWQELFFNHRYSFTQMLSPDFGLIAKANGIEYSLVEQRGELDDAVSRMLMHKGPYVMEVRVENEENVFPMVPAGAELSQIMLE